MKHVKIEEIKILPDRQRRIFKPEAITELVASIEEHGILHPPSCRLIDGEIFLMAGERRFRALSSLVESGKTIFYGGIELFEGKIPINLYETEVDAIKAEEIELDENIKREDLTWQERADAVARLHKLRLKQNPDQSVADTALEIRGSSEGSNQGNTRNEIMIAEYLDNPEVAKAKSIKEAISIVKKQERDSNKLMRSLSYQKKDDDLLLLEGNCLLSLKRWKDKFDVILTDPPYGIGADTFGDSNGRNTDSHLYDDSFKNFQLLMNEFAPLSYEVAKEEAHLYCFCDIDRFGFLKTVFSLAGWTVFRTPFVILKDGGRVPIPHKGPRRQSEYLLYANKGNKPQQLGADWIISDKNELQDTEHGAKKSASVYKELLRRSCNAGDIVLDAFAGSGTIFAAADELQLKAVGIEMNPLYIAECNLLIQKLTEG
jgi:16S rRNA G966 N2-methylase RsmD